MFFDIQQFQVPKFIDLQEKILGPLTLPQTLTIAIGAVLGGSLYFVLESFLFVPAVTVVGIASFLLAFFRMNERPLADYVINIFAYTMGPRLYVWSKGPQKMPTRPEEARKKESKKEKVQKLVRPVLHVTPEKIKELAGELDRELR